MIESVTIEHTFKDNGGYANCVEVPHIEALAHAMDWLWEKESGEYNMCDHILLSTFMTCVHAYICLSVDGFGKSDARALLLGMKINKSSYGKDTIVDNIIYTDDGHLQVSNLSYQVIEAMIWATIVYFDVLIDLYPDNDKYKRGQKMMLEFFCEETGLASDQLDLHFLMQHRAEVAAVMKAHIKLPINKPEEAEKQDAEKAEEVAKGLTTSQAALFVEALSQYMKFELFTNKQKTLGPLGAKLFGKGAQSMKNKLSAGYAKKDREAVASLFDELQPEFAQHIRKFESEKTTQKKLKEIAKITESGQLVENKQDNIEQEEETPPNN